MLMQILPLAAAFVGYIVFWNLSLQLNSVGFYQLSKILIAPAIILIEAVWFKKVPTRLELAAVALLCIGVTLATVSDSEVSAPWIPLASETVLNCNSCWAIVVINHKPLLLINLRWVLFTPPMLKTMHQAGAACLKRRKERAEKLNYGCRLQQTYQAC
jgi:hypothetical protein